MPLGSDDELALSLVKLIDKVCPRIVFSEDQADQVGHFMRQAGIRFPSQRGILFRELDENNKLVPLLKSQVTPLTEKQAKLLKGRGHENVKDDRLLVEAAIARTATIITPDPWVQKKHATWIKELGVGVYSPDEVHG